MKQYLPPFFLIEGRARKTGRRYRVAETRPLRLYGTVCEGWVSAGSAWLSKRKESPAHQLWRLPPTASEDEGLSVSDPVFLMYVRHAFPDSLSFRQQYERQVRCQRYEYPCRHERNKIHSREPEQTEVGNSCHPGCHI